MKLTCFGVAVSFGYGQIGGTDSLFRRIAGEMTARGHSVEFVHYGCGADRRYSPKPGLDVFEFRSFAAALAHVESGASVVLVNAVRSEHRLSFIRFRIRTRGRIDFYIVYSFFARTPWRRLLHFLDAEMYPYRPGALCVSPRLVAEAAKRRQVAHLLPPPVPASFFRGGPAGAQGRKRVVTYTGRLEEGKGAVEAIETMERLAGSPGLELRVSAYAFKGERAADALEKRARAVPGVRCVRREHDGWSPAVEAELAAELAETDFLLLPYRDASCSIDVPLLLLEGMANGCCVLTRPVGEIPTIYGASPFVIAGPDFPATASAAVLGCPDGDLARERERIARRSRELAFDTPSVTDTLLRIITENRRGQ